MHPQTINEQASEERATHTLRTMPQEVERVEAASWRTEAKTILQVERCALIPSLLSLVEIAGLCAVVEDDPQSRQAHYRVHI